MEKEKEDEEEEEEGMMRGMRIGVSGVSMVLANVYKISGMTIFS